MLQVVEIFAVVLLVVSVLGLICIILPVIYRLVVEGSEDFKKWKEDNRNNFR